MTKLFKAILVSISLWAAVPAMAATEGYGTLLAGQYQPSATFASLSVTGSGSVYQFTLTAFDLNALFTNNAFIGAIAVDESSDIQPLITGVSGGSPVSVSPGKGPTGAWEFRFDLTGKHQARLTANESVTWTATFASPVSFVGDEFALHVQGLTKAQGESAWYVNTVSAVPEPESYAMMLAGLGLMGFVVSRRKS